MVLSSKRVRDHFEQTQIVDFQGTFKVPKIHKPDIVQFCFENEPRARKRKATSALPRQQPRKRQPKSDYSWKEEEQLPRALASVSARIAEKFSSLTPGRPPDRIQWSLCKSQQPSNRFGRSVVRTPLCHPSCLEKTPIIGVDRVHAVYEQTKKKQMFQAFKVFVTDLEGSLRLCTVSQRYSINATI